MDDTVTISRIGYEGLCASYDRLHARVAELERERDKLQDALAITRNACASRKAQRDEYRHMAECAAIMAVAGYFSRMRGPHFYWNPADDTFCYAEDAGIMALKTPLYAGSAPVPAAVAKDAARYQFLRGIAYSGVSPRKELLWCLRGLYDTNGYSFDEAVDTAIAMLAAKAKGGA